PDLVFSEVDFLNSGSSKKREHDRSDNTYSKSTNRPITRSVRRKIDNVLQSQEDDSTQNQNVVEDNLSQNNDQSSADSSHSSQSHAGDAPSSESPSKLSPEAPPLNSDSNDHSYHGVQSIKSPYFAANVSDDGLQSQDCDNNCNQHQDTQKQIIQDKDDDDKTISSLEDVINSLHSNTGPADDYSCTYRPSGISNDIKDDIKDDSEFNETPEISCTYRPSGIFNDIKDDSEFNEIPEIRNQPNDYYKFSMSDANKKYSSISQAVSSYCASQKPSVTTIGVPSAAVKWLLNEQRTTPNYYASPYTDLHSNENIINEDMAINFREIDLSEIFIWRKHKLH
ncbi:16172_t:CDS:1, partial [Gigaspora rosea]